MRRIGLAIIAAGLLGLTIELVRADDRVHAFLLFLATGVVFCGAAVAGGLIGRRWRQSKGIPLIATPRPGQSKLVVACLLLGTAGVVLAELTTGHHPPWSLGGNIVGLGAGALIDLALGYVRAT